MIYRSEIDGLRAVAVLPVIAYHAGLNAASGGFVGVDVFFVISGFLITSIIHGELREGRFSLVTFYERRARRILPALFVVSLATLPFAWFWMLPAEFDDHMRALVAVNLFASNVFFWREAGYFAATADLKPLLHTWSLAVEEQFYFLFPLFLIILRKFRVSLTIIVLIALSGVSLALADWAVRLYPSATFYLLPTRAWELAAGAVLALSLAGGRPDLPRWCAELGGLAGLALILWSVVTYDSTYVFPGLWAVPPVLGTVLVIACAGPGTVAGGLLSLRPVVWIGLISYSTYLWHQPVFAFARLRLIDAPSDLMLGGLALVSLGLGYLSWRFVERPFRDRSLLTRRAIFGFAGAGSFALIAAGLILPAWSTSQIRLGPAQDVILARVAETQSVAPRFAKCMLNQRSVRPPDAACLHNPDLPVRAALWGDSHAGSVAHTTAAALSRFGMGMRELTFSGCLPVLGVNKPTLGPACPRHNAAVRDYLATHPEITLVVIQAAWSINLEGQGFDNGEGGEKGGPLLYALPLDRSRRFLKDPGYVPEVQAHFQWTVEEVLAMGKTVVLVYPIPEAGWNVPLVQARAHRFGEVSRLPLTTSHAAYLDRSAAARAAFDGLGDRPGLIRVFPDRIFCDTGGDGRCRTQAKDGRLFYSDDNHLTTAGGRRLGDAIARALSGRVAGD